MIKFVNTKKIELPKIRLIKLKDDAIKYKPENPELTLENMKPFVQASENIPEDCDQKPVKLQAAMNFDEAALDDTKNVLVEFHPQ